MQCHCSGDQQKLCWSILPFLRLSEGSKFRVSNFPWRLSPLVLSTSAGLLAADATCWMDRDEMQPDANMDSMHCTEYHCKLFLENIFLIKIVMLLYSGFVIFKQMTPFTYSPYIKVL